jgi:hypothetical protein
MAWNCFKEGIHGIFLSNLPLKVFQLSKFAVEQCADARHDFAFAIGTDNLDWLVFADESAIEIRTTYRGNGWALCSLRANRGSHFVRGTRLAVVLSFFM